MDRFYSLTAYVNPCVAAEAQAKLARSPAYLGKLIKIHIPERNVMV